jgi:hypothetical protein
VVLAPDLDDGVVDEDVDQLSLVGVADREHLVVLRHDAVGGDASKGPLAGVVLALIDRNRRGVLRQRVRRKVEGSLIGGSSGPA